MDASRICFHCAMTGTSFFIFTFKVYDPSQFSVYGMRSQLILFPLEYLADPEALVQETFLFSSELTWPLGRNQLTALV